MINTFIFDLGGVLIDWSPERLYRKLFTDETAMRTFLSEVCTMHWNEEQDAGRSLQEGTDLLVAQFPEQETYIRAYYSRWEEMLGGALEDTVALFRKLKQNPAYRFYALTNWSAETFGIALRRYDFLGWFDGIVVSGTEKMRKPEPVFYQLLLSRYSVIPQEALFIDDNYRNVLAAQQLGMEVVHFTNGHKLAQQLQQWQLL